MTLLSSIHPIPAETIGDANVILLLENHQSREDFETSKKVINCYYNEVNKDVILVEQSHLKNKENILIEEREWGKERYELFQNKNIGGWDHEDRDTWIRELNENPIYKKFKEAGDEQIVNQFENLVIKKTFTFRQQSLLKSIRSQVTQLKESGGKVFVIAGRGHWPPLDPLSGESSVMNLKIKKFRSELLTFSSVIVIN